MSVRSRTRFPALKRGVMSVFLQQILQSAEAFLHLLGLHRGLRLDSSPSRLPLRPDVSLSPTNPPDCLCGDSVKQGQPTRRNPIG